MLVARTGAPGALPFCLGIGVHVGTTVHPWCWHSDGPPRVVCIVSPALGIGCMGITGRGARSAAACGCEFCRRSPRVSCGDAMVSSAYVCRSCSCSCSASTLDRFLTGVVRTLVVMDLGWSWFRGVRQS